MNEPSHPIRIEPRWPVAITAVAVLFLLTVLPWRIRVFPLWVSYVSAIALLVPMVAVTLSTAKGEWLRVERATTLFFVPLRRAQRSLLWRACWPRWFEDRWKSAAINFLLRVLQPGP